MKSKIIWSFLITVFVSGILNKGDLKSQTAGTFTLSLTTTSTGGYSPGHVMAIWVENSSQTFIKTKLRRSSSSNLDHLALWTSRTGSNTVDAVTGATLTSHGNVTVVWNGTNVAGAVVPDGTYSVWVEMAWASSLTTGKTYSIFPFTKGPTIFNSAPANLTNFLNITLNWTPGSPTDVEKVGANTEASVYPNPTTDFIHIKFKNGHPSALIKIFNESGVQVYNEVLQEFPAGEKTIDISKLAAGVYYVSFHFEKGDESIRIVKTR